MSLDLAAAGVADEGLRALVDALATRDVDTVLALFTDRASVFGSEDAEVAIGPVAMRHFFDDVCGQPATYAWRWEVTAAGRDGDVVWFVAPGSATIRGDDGTLMDVDPYRLSGVLRQSDGRWLFELFNGSEPTVAA